MGSQLPPEPGVVGHAGRARQQRLELPEVIEVPQRTGHPGAGPGADRHLAGRGQAGVPAVAKRRVRGQRLEQREVAAKPVEDPDGGLRVRHPDVDVQPADRRGGGVAEQVPDLLIPFLVGDLGVVLAGRGMRPRPDQTGAGHPHRVPHRAELVDRVAGVCAHLTDELHLAGMQLGLDAAAYRAQLPLHGCGRIGQPAGGGIDQEQLLLDAE